jgi:hypothetical protein
MRRRESEEDVRFSFSGFLPIRKTGPVSACLLRAWGGTGVAMKAGGIAAAAVRMGAVLFLSVLCASCLGTGEGSTSKAADETQTKADGPVSAGTTLGYEAGRSEGRKKVPNAVRWGLTYEERESLREKLRKSRPSPDQIAEIRRRNAQRRAEALSQDPDPSRQYAMGTNDPGKATRKDF